jgi:hypothetical protein
MDRDKIMPKSENTERLSQFTARLNKSGVSKKKAIRPKKAIRKVAHKRMGGY